MIKKFILLIVFLAIAFSICSPKVFYEAISKASGSSIVSTTSLPAKQTVYVLFIGNSYTFVNNLPEMMVDIASSDPTNQTVFNVEMVTEGGAHLIDLWNEGNALAAIQSHHWDYVVMQDQSEWAMIPKDIESAYRATAKFAPEIKKAGATPVMYLTWAREPKSRWYTDASTTFLESPEAMQKHLDYYTYLVAKAINAWIIPAGDAWQQVLLNNPAIHLYQSDSSHPSEAGTYLTALLFYRFLSGGHDVEHATYQPENVTSGEAAYLKNTAAHFQKQ